MTALWTVTILLAALAAADSVAVIALTRQVGLLHLRIGPHYQQPPAGPQPGSLLQLDPARVLPGGDQAHDLVLLGFVRPTCAGCTAALPAFASVASGLQARGQPAAGRRPASAERERHTRHPVCGRGGRGGEGAGRGGSDHC